ncbi:Hypothetical predicted protein, partial [Pelobates cultripes]
MECGTTSVTDHSSPVTVALCAAYCTARPIPRAPVRGQHSASSPIFKLPANKRGEKSTKIRSRRVSEGDQKPAGRELEPVAAAAAVWDSLLPSLAALSWWSCTP